MEDLGGPPLTRSAFDKLLSMIYALGFKIICAVGEPDRIDSGCSTRFPRPIQSRSTFSSGMYLVVDSAWYTFLPVGAS